MLRRNKKLRLILQEKRRTWTHYCKMNYYIRDKNGFLDLHS